MRRSVIESEFLKFANTVHDENRLLIIHIREQNEDIDQLKNKIADLHSEIAEYEKEEFESMFIDAHSTTADTPINENTNLIQSQKRCCVICTIM